MTHKCSFKPVQTTGSSTLAQTTIDVLKCSRLLYLMYVCYNVPERLFNWGSDEARSPWTLKRQFFVQFIWWIHKRVEITSEPLRGGLLIQTHEANRIDNLLRGGMRRFTAVLPEHCGEEKEPYNGHHGNHTHTHTRF